MEKPNNRISFGPFVLHVSERRLERDGGLVRLGFRALELLICLVESAGYVVDKQDLLKRVWPGVIVDEGSLRFQLVAVRRALEDGKEGARYIINAPGRGYCFVAPITRLGTQKSGVSGDLISISLTSLPKRLPSMIGRADVVRSISSQLLDCRFVTIVGPGGIGKTTVAVSVAHELLGDFSEDVYFIDLGILNDPSLVLATVTSALGIPVQSDLISSLIHFLGSRRLLLIFDSCEHVIEQVALLAERIVKWAPGVHLLATSRESLRVDGEFVHGLSSLRYPANDLNMTASEALKFPAVRLFVDRVATTMIGFTLSDTDTRVVCEVCRRLDGVPLALELVAGRVGVYGLNEISELATGHVKLRWRGRRDAPPRQLTLKATLDWSYHLLSGFEQTVLNRLSAFVGNFTLLAAESVAAAADGEKAPVLEAVATLAEKSLILTNLRSDGTRYRLLDMTRSYALEKLSESGELNEIRRQHAIFMKTLFEYNRAELREPINPKYLVRLSEQIGNARAALEWSFSPSGDLTLGAKLIEVAAPVFLSMSSWEECQRWTELAIASLNDSYSGTSIEMSLQAARGTSLLMRHDPGDGARSAFARALEIAESIGDIPQQLQLNYSLHLIHLFNNNPAAAIHYGVRGETIAAASRDPAWSIVSSCRLALTYFMVGDMPNAQSHCESVLIRSQTLSRERVGHFENDSLSQTRCALAQTLWLRGFPDQAVKLARRAIDEAEASQDFILLSNAYLWITSVFFWVGDLSEISDVVDRFKENASRNAMGVERKLIGMGLQGRLLIEQGDAPAGIILIRECLSSLHLKAFNFMNLLALASGLAAIGKFDEALATIDKVLPEHETLWGCYLTAEAFRLQGSIVALDSKSDTALAERILLKAIAAAKLQSALSLELRAVTSLANLWKRLGRLDEARELLTEVFVRFTEGFQTRDLTTARRLMEDLECTRQLARLN